MRNVILLLSLLPFFAHADFKQMENSEFEFISTMVSKNLKDCLSKESVKEVGLSISNKTSQHIDKDAVSQNFSKSLPSFADVKVAKDPAATVPSLNVVMKAQIAEKNIGYESNYEILFHVAKSDKNKICDGKLVLTKSAVFK